MLVFKYSFRFASIIIVIIAAFFFAFVIWFCFVSPPKQHEQQDIRIVSNSRMYVIWLSFMCQPFLFSEWNHCLGTAATGSSHKTKSLWSRSILIIFHFFYLCVCIRCLFIVRCLLFYIHQSLSFPPSPCLFLSLCI